MVTAILATFPLVSDQIRDSTNWWLK